MKVSLNLIKKYIDLPLNLTAQKIGYDLTLKTVEVESIESISEKYKNIVVGKIIEVKKHPNADLLKICLTDIGEDKLVQILCGGKNLYEGEYVVVSLPGSKVKWHGEGEPIEIKETTLRGEKSFGMICGANEVYLSELFPPKDEHEIIDLKEIKCSPGQNIASVLHLEDTILEIDNKSLTNRPDLWGHYGIARELSAIYNLPLKEISKYNLQENLPKYEIEIKEPSKCYRYVAIEIENISQIKSPMWMQTLLINAGMRPINAIVDITNYVMLVTGQPMHAFDRTNVVGNKIIVRNAKKDEKLLLLDNNLIDLTEDDLVICDKNDAMALAGIRGGKKDSILPTTTGVLLEIANFTAQTIRKTGKRFDEKTDASIRYEKNIDTERIEQAISLSLKLIEEIFPLSKIVAYGDNYPKKTTREKIEISQEFLNKRLGKILSNDVIERVLSCLGYEVVYNNGIYNVTAPVWRSTGDVSIKDDVMGDIARILGYESFESKPITISIDKSIRQNKYLLERRIREYLSYRCGLNEIFTYPWIDEKYIKAAKIDIVNAIKLATPPSPEQANLRSSLIPGLLEAINKNLRYLDSFKMYEMAQVFEKGKYSPSTFDEILPVQKKYLTGCIVGKDAKKIFYEIKGIIENMAQYCHMDEIEINQVNKPKWADINAYLNILYKGKIIGELGLLSIGAMCDAKIKHTNVAIFEINFDELNPLDSRTNKFKNFSQYPLVEKDLSILIDNNMTWDQISNVIRPNVKELEFIEEYRGTQIPEGKKSITLRIKIGNDDSTMTAEQISIKMEYIIKLLTEKCCAILRED